jgi:hypothetical protein
MYYSQAGQDKFVIDTLSEKRNGTYVEIGAYHSKEISNTYTLEKKYDWSGISFEIVPERAREFNQNRSNPCYVVDATIFNYEQLFEIHKLPKQIDYLQVDIEPAENTLAALKMLPLEKYRFSVITFEHDLYVSDENYLIKNMQKEILLDLGYTLVRENVTFPGTEIPFEDWWIDETAIGGARL